MNRTTYVDCAAHLILSKRLIILPSADATALLACYPGHLGQANP